jgi:hypothetical protein
MSVYDFTISMAHATFNLIFISLIIFLFVGFIKGYAEGIIGVYRRGNLTIFNFTKLVIAYVVAFYLLLILSLFVFNGVLHEWFIFFPTGIKEFFLC